ncbi:PEP-CTERM/exosortase system-associated acyltransferase [Catenovulum agarivorans DS-2]|uniref:PEP-CTERM/exosortase system-associated acyltransferase n=1 Tax=Catenovulum agarivorans DS-2 TaxID=1328313 RepID=W7Q8L8_9ALTE|nr:GNAT family N-acyltransferase [Catenovulum agarivorans]EWH09149.1 PEP-CTERM/exosortase system-associated acyltransferase [Catenovulum agarivorans DS-2]
MLKSDHTEIINAPHIAPGEIFFRYFKIRFATADDMFAMFKLRYQVYCEEMGYFPNLAKKQSEMDEFDASALHCVIEHKHSGKIVGCMRAVPSNQRRLPLSTYLPHVKVGPHEMEVSRVVVNPEFRHEVDGYKIPGLLFNALFLAASHVVDEHANGKAYLFIEQVMARALKRAGFDLSQTPHMASVSFGNGKISKKYLYRVDTFTSRQTRPLRKSQFASQIGVYLYPEKYERRVNSDSVCPAIVRQPSRQQNALHYRRDGQLL